MQALTLLLAVAVGPGSGHTAPRPLPGLTGSVHSALGHPAELAGPRGCPRPGCSVECRVCTLFLGSWKPPRGSAPLGQFCPEDGHQEVERSAAHFWSHQAGPYRPSHPSGRPPSFLFCCLFLRENSTCSQNRKLSPSTSQGSVQCTVPSLSGPSAFSCHLCPVLQESHVLTRLSGSVPMHGTTPVPRC